MNFGFERDRCGWVLPMARPMANRIGNGVSELTARASQHKYRETYGEAGGDIEAIDCCGAALLGCTASEGFGRRSRSLSLIAVGEVGRELTS